VFEQFSQLVRTHYPHMDVAGDNYPPPPMQAYLARILSMVKMALLVCLLLGQNPFALMNLSTPTVYSWALSNRMYACLMIFFFSNSLESYLISTGAFEISVNDVPLWSKMQSGRLPSSEEFVQMLQTFATNMNSEQTMRPNS
jgi:thioredoxin reductase-like selenoprotein T